jgi:ADP-ribose pyrophosphatase YjhB (NUDIX family)
MLTVQKRPWIIRVLREMLYVCAPKLMRIYWWLFRPYRPGVKTFVWHEGKLLLVRLGYSHKKWVLPGGGIDRGEGPSEAAVREVKEESGLDIVSPIYVGEQDMNHEYKRVTQFYFTADAASPDLTIDGQEIVDAGWFPLDALPAEIAPRVPKQITLYNEWKSKK